MICKCGCGYELQLGQVLKVLVAMTTIGCLRGGQVMEIDVLH